jgi:hypothetical protein
MAPFFQMNKGHARSCRRSGILRDEAFGRIAETVRSHFASKTPISDQILINEIDIPGVSLRRDRRRRIHRMTAREFPNGRGTRSMQPGRSG